jgi:hypothetical protein
MSHKKQFGIWIDSHQAVIIGRENVDSGDFKVLGHAEADSDHSKLFKQVTALMQNAEEVHVTGTGDYQEQFIHHLAATPQFKNTIAKESTSIKMSDEKLVEYISAKFN